MPPSALLSNFSLGPIRVPSPGRVSAIWRNSRMGYGWGEAEGSEKWLFQSRGKVRVGTSRSVGQSDKRNPGC